MYVVFTSEITSQSSIMLIKSFDGGLTFSDTIRVSEDSDSDGYPDDDWQVEYIHNERDPGIANRQQSKEFLRRAFNIKDTMKIPQDPEPIHVAQCASREGLAMVSIPMTRCNR